MADRDVRRDFLDERREICRHRMDTLHAPVYDDRFHLDEVLEGDGYAHVLMSR